MNSKKMRYYGYFTYLLPVLLQPLLNYFLSQRIMCIVLLCYSFCYTNFSLLILGRDKLNALKYLDFYIRGVYLIVYFSYYLCMLIDINLSFVKDIELHVLIVKFILQLISYIYIFQRIICNIKTVKRQRQILDRGKTGCDTMP